MKFVHIADMHFDMPFKSLVKGNDTTLGELRRLEQRKVFRDIVEYIKENNIPYFFIAGDLYEQEYTKESTIHYINELFKQIPDTQIFIAPGNHDPYLIDSFYAQYNWANNVHIFNHALEKIEMHDATIFGYGFKDFYCEGFPIDTIQLDHNKLNILVIHGDLDASVNGEMPYNPISKRKLKEMGFDYVAMGHIHKLDYQTEKDQKIIYPGSTVSSGFDELGKHGMIVGNLEKNKMQLEFIPMDPKEMVEKEINISEIYSEEELIEYLSNLKIEENQYVKIILIGNRNFEINLLNIIKLNLNKNIIKIKDQTKIKYDIEKIKNENNLRGIFVNECMNEIKEKEISEELLEKIVELGLDYIS